MDEQETCSFSLKILFVSKVALTNCIFITIDNLFRVQEHGGEPIIPFSCILEKNLADMPPDEAAKYCEENKLQR